MDQGKLASEQVILSAPMSFSGSKVRIWKITKTDNAWLKWLVLVPWALTLISIVWCFVSVWYVFFSIWLIPYRLFRRGQRKDKKRDLQHREMLDAVKQPADQATMK